MNQVCPRCNGLGVRVIPRPAGGRAVEPCECQAQKRAERLLQRARIPARYEHCTLDTYDPHFHGADPSLAHAYTQARTFVDGYPVMTDGRGLLLTGWVGVGKTHLAVGILQSLIVEKGVRGLFCDYRELLKEIQHSWNPQVSTTEMDLLRPVFDAEVLVLDELGAARRTDWVWDMVALVLNTRYNDKRTTIITTNYPDAPSGASTSGRGALQEDTLGDRIGERMRSRLAEMCATVEMRGSDFRRKVSAASFR